MPLTVTCPTCASPVSVKDEYAGRKVRCPQCKTLLAADAPPAPAPPTLPPPPPPPPAKPILPAVPLSTRTKAIPAAVPAATPARKSKVQIEIDDDEPRRSPRKLKRAGPAPARGPLLWVLAGVGGLVLLLGGCAGLYFLLPWPSVGLFRPSSDSPTVTLENAKKMQSGMTVAEVEAVMGRGRAATEQDFVDAQNVMQERAFTESMAAWEPKLTAGEVLAWTKGKSRFLVGFSKPPGQGGTVVGVVAVIADGNTKWSYRYLETRSGVFAGNAPGNGPPPVPPVPDGPAELTADALLDEYAADATAAAAKYRGKDVTFTGLVGANSPASLILAKETGTGRYELRAQFGINERAAAGRVKAGDRVVITGRVGVFGKNAKTAYLYVNECKLGE